MEPAHRSFALDTRFRRRLASSTALSAGLLILGVSGATAVTVDVTDQAGFDAAIQAAITTGQPNTINVNIANPVPDPLTTIFANSGLALPGLASPLNLNFNLQPILGVGSSGTVGSLTIGAGTNLTFKPSGTDWWDIARFRIGRRYRWQWRCHDDRETTPADQSLGQWFSMSVGADGGVGVFNQSGGTVNVRGGAFQIGIEGQGVYNLSGNGSVIGSGDEGGSVDYATTVVIGESFGTPGNGVMNISGNATFSLTNETGGIVFVGNDGGTGTITQDGPGSHVVISGAELVQVGPVTTAPSAASARKLIAGSLDIATTAFGVEFGSYSGGVGTFNQSGGVFTSELLPAVFGSYGEGYYNLSGGTATFEAGLTIAENAGSTGVVTQTGGLLTVSSGQTSNLARVQGPTILMAARCKSAARIRSRRGPAHINSISAAGRSRSSDPPSRPTSTPR